MAEQADCGLDHGRCTVSAERFALGEERDSKDNTREQSATAAGRIRAGGIRVGIPGMYGMGRHGMHIPTNTTNTTNTSSSGDTNSKSPMTLTVRWESALPVQAVELKARNVNTPSMDDDHYAIAVYGIPSRTVDPTR